MKLIQRSVVVLGLLSVGIAAIASSVTGAWKGKVHVDLSSLPHGQNAQGQEKMMQQIKTMLAKMTILLTLKNDHTYSIKVSGGPGKGDGQHDAGTWSQSGSVVTLKSTEHKDKGEKSQHLNLSGDGKTMKMAIPGGGAKGDVVFSR